MPNDQESESSSLQDVQIHVQPESHGHLMNSHALHDELVADPGLRRAISDYDVTERERVRRAYLLRGPCQPILQNFPQTNFSGIQRRFSEKWYKEYGRWLEYSISKDAVFCLYCYLFKPDCGDAFIGEGFRNWKKKEKLDLHAGD